MGIVLLIDRLVDRSSPLSESLIKFLRNQIPFVSFCCVLENSCLAREWLLLRFLFFFLSIHKNSEQTSSEIRPRICMKIDVQDFVYREIRSCFLLFRLWFVIVICNLIVTARVLKE